MSPLENSPPGEQPPESRLQAYYLSAELHERLKAAWWATKDLPNGEATLSGLVARLLEQKAIALEVEKNEGERFPPAPAAARGARAAAVLKYKNKSYFIPVDTHARIKAAWWATRDAPSLSMLVARLMEAEAERLEFEHNAGERFPAAPPRARGVSPEASKRQSEVMTEIWRAARPDGQSDE